MPPIYSNLSANRPQTWCTSLKNDFSLDLSATLLVNRMSFSSLAKELLQFGFISAINSFIAKSE